MKIDGYTRLAAVVIKSLNTPFLAHSQQNLETNKLPMGFILSWEVEGTDLAETVANIRRYQMFRNQSFYALQEQVIPYLDQLVKKLRLLNFCQYSCESRNFNWI